MSSLLFGAPTGPHPGGRRFSRRRITTPSALVAAMVLLAAGIAYAVAVPTPGAPNDPTFEVEGNLLANVADDGDLDWDDGDVASGVIEAVRNGDLTCTQTNGPLTPGGPGVDGVGALICDGSSGGAVDQNSFTQGSKNEEFGSTSDAVWAITAGSSPKKGDLSEVYLYAKAADSLADPDTDADDLFLYFDLTRTDTDGSTNSDFEFNQNPMICGAPAGNTVDCTQPRVQDDLNVAFDFVSGGIPQIRVLRFYSDPVDIAADGITDADCANASQVDLPCYVEVSGGNAQGFVNGVEVPVASWGSVHCEPTTNEPSSGCNINNSEIPANGNMEGFVDLTSFFGDDQFDICTGFGQAMAKTRSSDDLNSALKDLAGPLEVNLSLCGASIEIAPDDLNEVGDPHTFTVTVNQELGATSQPAAGADVDVTLTTSQGATVVLDAASTTCDVPAEGIDDAAGDTDASGQCVVVFTSNGAGTVVGSASSTLDVFGTQFTVTTDGQDSNSSPATKRFVDASVSIGPSGVNRVGDSHDFTVTLTPDAPSGVSVMATTVSVQVNPVPDSSSGCTSLTVQPDGTYTCTLTISDADTGVHTASADVTITYSDGTNQVVVSRTTDGTGDNSGTADKRFVDARISIDPDDTNSIGESHTFTVLVEADDGSGFSATDVDAVSVTLTPAGGASASGVVDTCADGTGDAGEDPGECSVTFTSNSAGTITGSASATVSLTTAEGTIDLAVSTGDANSPTGSAAKQFVAGSITWTKVDNAGDAQGGATFEVCRTHDFNSSTSGFDDIDPDACFDVVDNGAGDSDPDAGELEATGLVLGRYTVTETSPPAGFQADPDTETVELTLTDPDATISTAFVNSRPIVKLTEFGYTNQPTGTPATVNSGILAGQTTFTVELDNFGTADATLSGSLTITGSAITGCSSPSTGAQVTLTGCTLSWVGLTIDDDGGTAAPSFEVVVDYSGNDGDVITADLVSQYTLNNLARDASGSPAQISFTIQGD